MPRDLYNVRLLPADDDAEAVAPAPLSAEEERRYEAVLLHDLGGAIADRGWARFPAWTPEDRIRLVRVAERLTAHWGRRVTVEAEDHTRFLLRLEGAVPDPARPLTR